MYMVYSQELDSISDHLQGYSDYKNHKENDERIPCGLPENEISECDDIHNVEDSSPHPDDQPRENDENGGDMHFKI